MASRLSGSELSPSTSYHGHALYLILTDLEAAIMRYSADHVAIPPALKIQVESLERRFLADFSALLPKSVALEARPIREVVTSLLEEAARSQENSPAVSLDPVLGKASGIFVHSLDITKNADTGGGTLKPRVGEAMSPKEQVRVLSLKLSQRDPSISGVTLVEIGCFTGRTLGSIMDFLYENGIPVANIVIGMASEDAVRVLASRPSGRHADITVINKAIMGTELRKIMLGSEISTNGNRAFKDIAPTNFLIPSKHAKRFEELRSQYRSELIGLLSSHGIDLTAVARRRHTVLV